ncbi:TPA: phosphoribosylformimino-5-aminoimidazole carboxamide ribotide isomerase [Candidatus Latescibacteria bacterium]|nr:phosphoribosylformimino-5-aminoimidazole carboxamide ribotide isomerase [Candidatus Latescibacterota bacterium]
MRFRPCIDLRDGKVVQIVGSTIDRDGTITNFEASEGSGHFAEIYRKDALPGGHVIQLGSGNESAAVEALRAYPGGLHVGGGVNPENASQLLEAGASHVIVTSYVFKGGQLDSSALDRMVATVGKERLVLDLSCRMRDGAYYVVTDRWQAFTDLEVNTDTLSELSDQCAEFLVHGVDVEGKRLGIQEELVELLGQGSPIPVTYAGGASSLADLELVDQLGGGRVDLTIGSALDLFGGDVAYADVVAWHRRRNGEDDASE